MQFEKFKNLFHESWHDKMIPFIESEECDNIYKFLKSESQRGKRIAPLSVNVYRCFLEFEFNLKHPDLSYLAHQGVLLWNAALTTEINKAGSHLELWEPFTKYVFQEILSTTGVPTIFLGKEAAKFERYTGLFSHNFPISHPASAAYKKTDWSTEGVFTKVNKILKEVNNYEINWLYKEPPF